MYLFLKKYKSYIYTILIDIVCVFGVILFGWNVLNIMLFYWLDIVIMMLFVTVYLKRVNTVPLNFQMFLGVAMMLFFFCLLYYGILFFGESLGYRANHKIFMAFDPVYMVPVFSCSSVMNNFKEFKYYEQLVGNKTHHVYQYPTLLILRLFSIEAILVTGALIKADVYTAILMIVIVKFLLMIYEQRKNPQENA